MPSCRQSNRQRDKLSPQPQDWHSSLRRLLGLRENSLAMQPGPGSSSPAVSESSLSHCLPLPGNGLQTQLIPSLRGEVVAKAWAPGSDGPEFQSWFGYFQWCDLGLISPSCGLLVCKAGMMIMRAPDCGKDEMRSCMSTSA